MLTHPKHEVEKRAITLTIIGRFYPKSNLTIFMIIYLCIKYESNTSIFFKQISEGKHFLKVKKGHNSHNNGWILPYSVLTSGFMIIYLCVTSESKTVMFSKDIKLKLFFNIE